MAARTETEYAALSQQGGEMPTTAVASTFHTYTSEHPVSCENRPYALFFQPFKVFIIRLSGCDLWVAHNTSPIMLFNLSSKSGLETPRFRSPEIKLPLSFPTVASSFPFWVLLSPSAPGDTSLFTKIDVLTAPKPDRCSDNAGVISLGLGIDALTAPASFP